MELDALRELLESLLFAVGVMLEQLVLRAAARVLALGPVTVELTLEGAAGTHAQCVLRCRAMSGDVVEADSS